MQIFTHNCFDIEQPIVVAVTPLLTEDELRENWIKYRDLLMEEQVNEISDFMRWNFYLFYVVEDKTKINRSLKYEVEHNTISSRKIIVNEIEYGGNVNSLISSYIQFKIQHRNEDAEAEPFIPKPEIKKRYDSHED